MRTLRRHRTGTRGFTFLEIMLVVVIIGILAALVGPRLVGRTNEARVTATQTQLNGIEQAIKSFEIDTGTFPKTLKELVEEPTDNDSWKGPYFDKEEVPKDAWQQEFEYKYPGSNNKRTYDLWSKGADKQSNTEDDIANWTKKS